MSDSLDAGQPSGAETSLEDELASILSAEDDQYDDQDEQDDESSDEVLLSDESAEKGPAKRKVVVSGQEIEVDEQELIAGYQRQQDYTQKTQQIASERKQYQQAVSQQIQEVSQSTQRQLLQAQTLVDQLLQVRSPQELQQLANTDPAAAFQESLRLQQIQQARNAIAQQLEQNEQMMQQQQAQQIEEFKAQSWQELSKQNITRPVLQEIYTEAAKAYGFSGNDFDSILDHRAVLVLRDAVAYQKLLAKKGQVVKQVTSAPPMPRQKTVEPANQRNRELDKKFAAGRANTRDLASLLESRMN